MAEKHDEIRKWAQSLAYGTKDDLIQELFQSWIAITDLVHRDRTEFHQKVEYMVLLIKRWFDVDVMYKPQRSIWDMDEPE